MPGRSVFGVFNITNLTLFLYDCYDIILFSFQIYIFWTLWKRSGLKPGWIHFFHRLIPTYMKRACWADQSACFHPIKNVYRDKNVLLLCHLSKVIKIACLIRIKMPKFKSSQFRKKYFIIGHLEVNFVTFCSHTRCIF
jgi:hypothetical protein